MALPRAYIEAPSTFEGISITELENLSHEEIDRLPFGVVGLSRTGVVELYSAFESRASGLGVDEVLHDHFFENVARCMKNNRVAGKLAGAEELDEIVEHVLTLRMKITPATLRLLRNPSAKLSYLLIQRHG